jgi:hypothetical protein
MLQSLEQSIADVAALEFVCYTNRTRPSVYKSENNGIRKSFKNRILEIHRLLIQFQELDS